MNEELRLTLMRGGYAPIPLMGKVPAIERWQTFDRVGAGTIEMWGKVYGKAVNTGILTRAVPAFDIDVRNPEAAEAVEAMVREYYEEKGKLLLRIGNPPKRAFLFRTDYPFKKMSILFEDSPDKLEFLGDGQQIVVDGIHPDTGKPYRWFTQHVMDVPRLALPEIRAAEAAELIERAAEVMEGFGYKRASGRPKAAKEGNGAGPADWGYLLNNIKSGQDLHDSTRDLAAKLIASGMSGGAVVNFVRSLMEGLPRDERWQARWDDIPRAVSGAEVKYTPIAPPIKDQGDFATPYILGDPKDTPLRDWLYGWLLVRKFVSFTAAPGGSGKSSLVTVEALAQVTGRDLLGTSSEQLRVWLWNLEDPREEIDRRIKAAALHYGLNREDIGDRLFVNSGRDRDLVIVKSEGKRHWVTPIVGAMIAEIQRLRIDIVVIDPFVSCNEVDENDNNGQDLVVKAWARVAELGNCAVHLVDHTRKVKEGEGGTGVEGVRGAKAKTDAARVVRVINQMSAKQAKEAGVMEDVRRSYFQSYKDKSNMAPPAARGDWYRFESINLGNGGKDIVFLGHVLEARGDKVGVVTPYKWEKAAPDLATGEDFERVAAAMGGGMWRASHKAGEDWVGVAIATAMKLDVEDPTDRQRIIGLIKMWLKSGALEQYMAKDEQRRDRPCVRVSG